MIRRQTATCQGSLEAAVNANNAAESYGSVGVWEVWATGQSRAHVPIRIAGSVPVEARSIVARKAIAPSGQTNMPPVLYET